MKKKEINKKYNIKMILEEMYVWDDDPKKAEIKLVFYSYYFEGKYFYLTFAQTQNMHPVHEAFTNAMAIHEFEYIINEKKPDPEIKTGDYGYFWNDDLKIKSFYWGKLESIGRKVESPEKPYIYFSENEIWFDHFSKTRPEWSLHI